MKIPSSLSLPEIQQSMRDVWQALDKPKTVNVDMNGQRFLNVSDARSLREFVTMGQADSRYVKTEDLKNLIPATVTAGALSIRFDTFANRGGANSNPYTLFAASDRNYVLLGSDGENWHYIAGVQDRTQAQLAALAATLGSYDVGYLVNVTDYCHVLRWTGSAWEWGPGEVPGGYVAYFLSAPTSNGWVLVNGSATTILKSDGTTTSVTPYDVTSLMLPYLRR